MLHFENFRVFSDIFFSLPAQSATITDRLEILSKFYRGVELKKFSIIFIGLCVLTSLFLFQNCSGSVKSSALQGSNTGEEDFFAPNDSQVSCERFTTYINCEQENLGSVGFHANGCPERACLGQQSVNCQDHTNFISCDSNTIVPPGTLSNGCPIAACRENENNGTCNVSNSVRSTINNIYLKWFNRDADDSGICYHAGLLANHGDTTKLEVDILVAMQEADAQTILSNAQAKEAAINFCAENGNLVPRLLTTLREKTVVDIYLEWFGRAPRFSGLNYWANDTNHQGVQLEHILVSSAQSDDRSYVTQNKAGDFRAFCQRHNFAIPDWL